MEKYEKQYQVSIAFAFIGIGILIITGILVLQGVVLDPAEVSFYRDLVVFFFLTSIASMLILISFELPFGNEKMILEYQSLDVELQIIEKLTRKAGGWKYVPLASIQTTNKEETS